MDITAPLVLPDDTVIVPVKQLPPQLREKLKCEDGDYAVTRPLARTPSKIIDAQAAELLKEFQKPKTIVDVVISYSRAKKADPERILEEAFPLIQQFMHAHLLVPPDSTDAKRIVACFDVGDRITDFEVLRCIQVLEDTELYYARRQNGEEAALKITRPNGNNREVEKMFDREAAILNHLDGVVNPRLLDRGVFEERQFLAIEWHSGVNAETAASELRLLSNTASQTKLLHLCRRIAEAYAHLHTQNVIHSDIHPRNVLVTSDGLVKIVDFGLARLENGSGDLDNPLRGGIGFFFDPEYAEALRSHRKPPKSNKLAEQYSLAAMLYSLLTGNYYLDFSAEKNELLRQVVEDAPLSFSNRGIRPWSELENVLIRALNKNPSERYESMDELSKKLRAVVAPNNQHGSEFSDCSISVDMSVADKLLNDVLQRVGTSGPLISSGLTKAPVCSVNYGAAGIAYALYRISCVRSDAQLLSLADIWSSKAMSNIGKNEAFFSTDITPEVVGRISPYHTESGVHCVQALIGHAMGDLASQQAAINAFVAASKAPCDNLDLTLGKSSTLLACSMLLDVMPVSDMLDSGPLLDLGKVTMRSIWEKIDAFASIEESLELSYLGIAHGWAGILYATMRWCQSSGDELPGTVPARLKQLAECAEEKGRGVRWKWQMMDGDHQRNNSYMPGWCNGTAGYIHLWTLAHRLHSEDYYLKLAEKAAWNTWEEQEGISSICCGLAGRAYGLLNLYKYTGEKEWLYRAQHLANRAAVVSKTITYGEEGLFKNSLYKGDIGIAVLVADLSEPEGSCLPFFEKEGWS